jgi:hypothetical protein
MQERPNKQVLLSAIARFLVEDVRPALSDPRLSFRALIAANLASIVASELSSDDEHARGELERLRAIFPDEAATPMPPRTDERIARVITLNARLCDLLKDGAPDEAALAKIHDHVWQTLKDKLSIDNPRFDLSKEIE